MQNGASGAPFFCQFTAHDDKAAYMRQKSQKPARRIGQIQRCHRMELLHPEKRKYPEKPQAAGADQRYDHRHNRIAQAPQSAYHNIHHAAERIEPAYDLHSPHTRFHDRRARRIHTKQRITEEHRQIPEYHTRHDDAELRRIKNPIDPFIFRRSHILARKRNRRLMECVHGNINKTFNIGSRRITRDGHGTERIDRRLNDNVGEGKQDSLKTGRKPNLQNPFELITIHAQRGQFKMDASLLFHHTADDQYRGNALRDCRCRRNARHVI